MHIGTKWRELARQHGDHPAIIDDRGSWSYRDVHARIARFGNALAGLGLRKGDRVALLVPDIREYLEADYAIMSAGFVRVPLDPRLTGGELTALLRYAGVTALVTHATFAPAVTGLTGEVESLRHIVSIGGAGSGDGLGHDYEALLARASDRPPPEGDDGDLATLNFTGGTTGAPKAAMLRHRNLMAVARNTIHGFGIGGDSVFLNVRPLWPIAQVILMSHLFAGATVVLRRFEPDRFALLVQQAGATRTSLVPTQLLRCLDHVRPGDERLQRLQAIHVGGSRIPPVVFERTLEIIGPRIGVLYGLTEAPITCYLPPQALDGAQAGLIHSVGRVLGDYEVRLLDGEDMPSAGSGRSGEVLIRGDNVMAGYWQDEAATVASLRDGWLHTGDVGEFDQGGNLHIVGRLKDVIRSGSTSIIPKEVEDVIVQHPAVAEVAVIGLPDVEWGEAVTAFVVTKPGMSVAESDLVEHCRARLAGYKKPRSIRFVASLPRSHYGKVLRAQLIAQTTT
jgi:acyl-CoA synthetase (AMP-forming)/AMP-acid ligase II